jgi:hypothetical protein
LDAISLIEVWRKRRVCVIMLTKWSPDYNGIYSPFVNKWEFFSNRGEIYIEMQMKKLGSY